MSVGNCRRLVSSGFFCIFYAPFTNGEITKGAGQFQPRTAPTPVEGVAMVKDEDHRAGPSTPKNSGTRSGSSRVASQRVTTRPSDRRVFSDGKMGSKPHQTGWMERWKN